MAVLYESAPPATIEGLPLDLENAIHQVVARPVQVIVLNTAPVSLVHRVLRDGVLLVDRDPGARIRFEVDARNRYFDLQPFLRRYRRVPRGRSDVTDAKPLAFIETCSRELATMARLDRVHDDLKEERFVEHTLQLAIQAALDVASHIGWPREGGSPGISPRSWGTWPGSETCSFTGIRTSTWTSWWTRRGIGWKISPCS